MTKIYYGVKANFEDGSFCGVFFSDKGDRHDAIKDYLSSGDILAVSFVEAYGDHEDKEKINLFDESDPRLSSDPLTALAAVMRQHGLTVIADGGVIIASVDSVIVADQRFELTADDIKPEQSNA